MAHYTNINRRKNIDTCMRLIAKGYMDGKKKDKKSFQGLDHTTLVAYLALTLGATKKKIGEYLTLLMEAGKLEYDGETKIWSLPK